EKTNICDVCGRGFAEKYTLNRHMLTHTHIKPYACTKCNMAFSRSDGLAKHMAAGHRRIDAHHCDVCGGTFNSEVSFEQHRREYGNTLPFVCNLCMLAFSQCCHLNYHMKSHSLSKINEGFGNPNANLFRCEICGKGFTRKYHMQRHERMHRRGPIPRAHLLDWTRRPYACGVCKMGFTRQHHLTRHMLIHTGERPHSCHVCGKAFRRFTNLTLHVRTVHGAERPFKCHICGRGFPRLYSLQRHLRLH
ncbi:hypothetical protein EGW08_016503, partial [Elysia chlorotica]